MGNYILPNGNVITLRCIGTGATAPDVVWVHESLKDTQVIVGKIEGFNDHWKATVYNIDTNHIKIRFTDTIGVRGGFRDFIIDLNNRITMNDDSPYNE